MVAMFRKYKNAFVLMVIATIFVMFVAFQSSSVSISNFQQWIHRCFITPTNVALSGNVDQQFWNAPRIAKLYNKNGSTIYEGSPVKLDTTGIIVCDLQIDTINLTVDDDLSGEEGYFTLVIEVDSLGTSSTVDTATIQITGTDQDGNAQVDLIDINSRDGAGVYQGSSARNIKYTSSFIWKTVTAAYMADQPGINAACSLRVVAKPFGSIVAASGAGDINVIGTAVADSIEDEAAGNVHLRGTFGIARVDSTNTVTIEVGSKLGLSGTSGFVRSVSTADSAFAIALKPHRRGDGQTVIPVLFEDTKNLLNGYSIANIADGAVVITESDSSSAFRGDVDISGLLTADSLIIEGDAHIADGTITVTESDSSTTISGDIDANGLLDVDSLHVNKATRLSDGAVVVTETDSSAAFYGDVDITGLFTADSVIIEGDAHISDGAVVVTESDSSTAFYGDVDITGLFTADSVVIEGDAHISDGAVVITESDSSVIFYGDIDITGLFTTDSLIAEGNVHLADGAVHINESDSTITINGTVTFTDLTTFDSIYVNGITYLANGGFNIESVDSSSTFYGVVDIVDLFYVRALATLDSLQVEGDVRLADGALSITEADSSGDYNGDFNIDGLLTADSVVVEGDAHLADGAVLVTESDSSVIINGNVTTHGFFYADSSMAGFAVFSADARVVLYTPGVEIGDIVVAQWYGGTFDHARDTCVVPEVKADSLIFTVGGSTNIVTDSVAYIIIK